MKDKELQAQRERDAAELLKEETLKRLDLQILERKVQLADKQIEYARTMKMLALPMDPSSSAMGNFPHEGSAEGFSDVQFLDRTGRHHHSGSAAAALSGHGPMTRSPSAARVYHHMSHVGPMSHPSTDPRGSSTHAYQLFHDHTAGVSGVDPMGSASATPAQAGAYSFMAPAGPSHSPV